jgi:FkbM family methyltransferase
MDDEPELPPAQGVGWLNATLIAYCRSFEHPFKVRMVRMLARRLAANRILVGYASGAVIDIDPVDYVGWTIFKTGHYERASLGLALHLMRQDPGLFVDVGANIGWYTCAVSIIPGARVLSVEPDSESCTWLRRNIAINRPNDVAVFAGAIGQDVETVRMTKRAATNSGTVAVALNDDGKTAGDWVATTPLETVLKRIVRPPAKPTLLKVDVEGFERQVLAGLDFSGPFRPKNVLMEFVDEFRAWSFQDVQEFFAVRNYRLCDVLGRVPKNAKGLLEANLWAQDQAI